MRGDEALGLAGQRAGAGERLKGNKKEAARQLGVSLKTLYNKLSKYGLREQFVQR